MDAGVMVLDLQDRVLDINPAFEKIIGYTSSMVSTRQVKEVCGKIPELAGACEDRSATQREFSINIDGLPKDYEVLISPLTDNKGILIGRLAVTHDITEKKQAQQAFLKQQWERAIIEERERMARDLHDNLGQVLGFINLQAQGIRQELINTGIDTVSDKLDKLVDVTQSAHAEIREYIRNVRGWAYIEKDFVTALKKNVSSFEEQTGLCVKLDIPCRFTGEEFKLNTKINILYIIKEALNNVRKHAEARHVKILFSLEQKQLCAVVEDDGKGFQNLQSNSAIKTRFGLDIMRERTSEIGGQIDVTSVTGKGSRVTLRVPYTEEVKNKENEIDAGR
jgi:PAS domain S-box-containing protein